MCIKCVYVKFECMACNFLMIFGIFPLKRTVLMRTIGLGFSLGFRVRFCVIFITFSHLFLLIVQYSLLLSFHLLYIAYSLLSFLILLLTISCLMHVKGITSLS